MENNDFTFLRRKKTIKDLIDNGIEVLRNDTDICDYTFSDFLTEVCWQVSDNSDVMGIYLDLQNQEDLIHRWVRNNFSQHIKDEYLELIDSEGCNDYDESDFDDYLSGFLYGVDNNQ
jgi:hypothetical protein